MNYPAKVSSATQQYRNSQDIIGQFIAANCVLGDYAQAKFGVEDAQQSLVRRRSSKRSSNYRS
jgi:hypothetical protein